MPLVKVPVLSKQIYFTLCAFSRASLVLTKIPFLLAFPEAITIASGVASPKLQGHATTNTLTKTFIANEKSFEKASHNANAKNAIPNTTGTKYPLILSAILAIGAFVLVASTTSLTIEETVESLPIFSALYFMVPSKFILPAITLEPTSLFTGTLSPVIKDSLT